MRLFQVDWELFLWVYVCVPWISLPFTASGFAWADSVERWRKRKVNFFLKTFVNADLTRCCYCVNPFFFSHNHEMSENNRAKRENISCTHLHHVIYLLYAG